MRFGEAANEDLKRRWKSVDSLDGDVDWRLLS
jgi:hypothetical protein